MGKQNSSVINLYSKKNGASYRAMIIDLISYLLYSSLPFNSDAPKLSSTRLSSDSARARGLPARLGSARAFFEPARIVKI